MFNKKYYCRQLYQFNRLITKSLLVHRKHYIPHRSSRIRSHILATLEKIILIIHIIHKSRNVHESISDYQLLPFKEVRNFNTTMAYF